MPRPEVEILYFDGCPNHEAAEEDVRRVIRAVGVDADVRTTEVADAEAAVRLRFLGSPTVRVDGRDVEEGADARTDFHHACRVYRTESGLRGRPDERWVRAAIAAAARAH